MSSYDNLRRIHRRRRIQFCRLAHLVAKIQMIQVQLMQTLVLITQILESTSSSKRRWGGRVPGSKNLKRRKVCTWFEDYLGDSPVYPPKIFRRRFGVPRSLFYRLRDDLVAYNPAFWTQRRRGFGPLGHTPEQRILSALRILSTGCSRDNVDDGSVMSEESISLSFAQFCSDVVSIYGPSFLNRRPTKSELKEISERYTTVGFPGCIGAVDCMKLYWKNCPYYEKGQNLNTKESTSLATIVCEAWCDHDLYCWNWYPCRAGTNNDLTVLHSSPLFRDIFNDFFKITTDDVYTISPSTYLRRMYYFLVDGIYPSWPFYVKPIHKAPTKQKEFFSARQEATRKDVERLFGVLQARFGILRLELEEWYFDDIIAISNTCVILHNLIVRMQQNGEFYEEVGDTNVVKELCTEETRQAFLSSQEYEDNLFVSNQTIQGNIEDVLDDLVMTEIRLTDVNEHERLMNDLCAHMQHVKDIFN